jgi:hypothetical protein
MSWLIDIKHCTHVLLNIFSNLDSIFANELAVGNVNIKSWEKVNSFPLFAKVGGNILYI